jgi:hypothetical protein
MEQHLTNPKLADPRTAAALLLALAVLPAIGEAAPQCGNWASVPTPNVGDSVTRLRDVTALSASDAWAVGLWRNTTGAFGPLAMRWNGTSWSQTALPSTSHLGALPTTEGVTSAPNGDVWVVGNVFVGYPYDNRPLVLRWRGGSWDYVDVVTLHPSTTYPFAPRGGLLEEAATLAADDIWAVGLAGGDGAGGASTVPLAIHWDGSSWTETSVPSVSNRSHRLHGVVALSHNDVWAVGSSTNVADVMHAVTFHWDGTSWSHISSPIEALGQSDLSDVVATGPDDVWAIGGVMGGAVVLMHWNGTQWSLAQAPPDSGGALAAVAPNDLWASGWNGFWHWNGSAWTASPSPVPGSSYVIRGGGMEIVGSCDVWSVGFWTLADGITSFTLAERLNGSGTSFCFGDASAGPCPCGNNGSPGRGCQNSASTGGALQSGSGNASLAADTLVLTSTGELPSALSIFLQGTTAIAPLVFGDGLRCTGGALKRLYVHNAAGGAVSAPQPGEPSISARSAALGDLISAGATRYYQTYYRDPVLGFCDSPPGNTWNVSSGLSILWAQ